MIGIVVVSSLSIALPILTGVWLAPTRNNRKTEASHSRSSPLGTLLPRFELPAFATRDGSGG